MGQGRGGEAGTPCPLGPRSDPRSPVRPELCLNPKAGWLGGGAGEREKPAPRQRNEQALGGGGLLLTMHAGKQRPLSQVGRRREAAVGSGLGKREARRPGRALPAQRKGEGGRRVPRAMDRHREGGLAPCQGLGGGC